VSETAKTAKRLLTQRRKAEQLDVNPKTIVRWWQSGILKPPTVINGRNYYDADDKPRADGEAA
jgi:DNA-binding transcriptional MerR regulator